MWIIGPKGGDGQYDCRVQSRYEGSTVGSRVILAKAEQQGTRSTGHDHRRHEYAAYRPYVTDTEVASDKSSRNGTEATACNTHAYDDRWYQESLHRDNQGGSGQCNPKSHEGSKKLETKPVAIPTYADAYPSSNYRAWQKEAQDTFFGNSQLLSQVQNMKHIGSDE